MIRKLDDDFAVAAQIQPDDAARIADAGFVLLINNRPDDEETNQPTSDEISVAAEAAGLGYRTIPVGHAGFSHAQLDAMIDALGEASGPVLAFCRSGTRSAFLWALARAKQGESPDALSAKAARAGYDLRPIRPMLDALSPT